MSPILSVLAAEPTTSQLVLDIARLVVDFVASVAWPFVVCAIVYVFHPQLTNLLKSLKRFRYKDFEFEMEERENVAEEQVALIEAIVANSAHSFRHIRDNTQLKLSDEEFDALIEKNPNIFQSTRIVHRDENGNRIPGLLGVKLKKQGI